LIDLIKPTYVLNAGCGEGFDTKYVFEKGDSNFIYYCGLDINIKALKVAKGLLRGHKFDATNGDIYNLLYR
jgi:SAM-dependent methyltransferase